jgi:CubicO group peptidase (beta-lactamase class C family)
LLQLLTDMRIKVLWVFGLFVLFFLVERTVSFSSKSNNDDINKDNVAIPLSYKISGSLSDIYETRIVDSFLLNFMKKNGIVGSSISITKNGRLVYSKGFGYADSENKDTMTTRNVFRIASVSKLITAVAIMKLVEDQKLEINTHVFGPNGILNDSIYLNYKDKRFEQITVHELLNHTAGWNGKKSDPVFNALYVARVMNVAPPASIPVIIEYSLNKKLDYSPGRTYSYSNLGYCILGEIIKKISGMEYEDYVQFAILHPLGIYDMHIGRSFYNLKYPDEVRYYDFSGDTKVWAFNGSDSLVSAEYGGNCIELLGAAGGWVASATELARLMVAIDGFDTRPDILSKRTIQYMTESNESVRKLIGWRSSDGNGTWWRTGTFSGTSALLMRHRNEINWVVLLNTTTKKRSHIHNDLSKTMFQALRSVNKWPEFDLFNYEPATPVNRFLADHK